MNVLGEKWHINGGPAEDQAMGQVGREEKALGRQKVTGRESPKYARALRPAC